MSKIARLFGQDPEPASEAPEIDIFFADDARQRKPRRPGMEHRELIAIGGFSVGAEEVGPLSGSIDTLCDQTGFPANEEFKWSPPPDSWMAHHLVERERVEFYRKLCELLRNADATATIIISDTACQPAVTGARHERSIAQMFLERVSTQCGRGGSHGFIIADRPGGGPTEDASFLRECLEMIQTGTGYVKPERIAHNVVSTPSRLSRPLQASDVLTSCTLAMVAGNRYGPPVFEYIKPLLARDGNRVGGVGLKIHPDLRYLNLYHWLVEDTHFFKGGVGRRLPLTDFPYARDADTYR